MSSSRSTAAGSPSGAGLQSVSLRGRSRPGEAAIKACLFVATAVAGGYAVLLFSYDYKVHVWLSSFIVLAMLASVLSALLLIPGAILAWRPGFVFKRRSSDLAAVLLVVLASAGFLLYSQLAWAAPAAAEATRSVPVERPAAATAAAAAQAQTESGPGSGDGATRPR